MKVFRWSPITREVNDGGPNDVSPGSPPSLDERAQVHPIVLSVDDEYDGAATLHVPVTCAKVQRTTLVNRQGVSYDAYVIQLPARAFAEFGLRVAQDRVGALLRGLLNRLQRDAEASS